MKPSVAQLRRPRRHRGSIHVLVLGIGLLLSVTGITMLAATQISTRTSAGADDAAETAVLAESAVEYALARLKANANWRTTYTNNVETAQVPFGQGTISFKLIDEADGNLSNNTTDAVRVYGIGRVRKATRVYSMKCGPLGLSSLTVPMSLGGLVTLGAASFPGSGTISSNGSINCTNTSLGVMNLEAGGEITLLATTGTGTRRFPVPAKEMPNAATVFDHYVANGTRMTGIPVSTGVLQVTNVLVSPTNNPFGGGTNSKGIYYVDCGGASVQVSAVRIVGTMVFRNAGTVTLQTKMNLEPAVLGYPVLMVQGDLAWKTNSTSLADVVSPPLNFNPPGLPYPYNFGQGGGVDNTTFTDNYPTQIRGLMYISGTLSGNSNVILDQGVVVSPGGWAPTGSVNLTYDDLYYLNPAPGFAGATPVPMRGSWRWEPSP